jgi:hypothetical protein
MSHRPSIARPALFWLTAGAAFALLLAAIVASARA